MRGHARRTGAAFGYDAGMDELSAWLLTLTLTEPGEFTAAVAGRLIAAGVPVWRFTVSFSTMHPETGVVSILWTAEDGVVTRNNSHTRQQTPFFLDSPMAVISRGAPGLRRRLTGPEAQLDFPICRELAAQGATDYAVFALQFTHGRRFGMTVTTRHPDGFADAALAMIRAAVPALTRSLELVQSTRRACCCRCTSGPTRRGG